jgi:hypothetical protein
MIGPFAWGAREGSAQMRSEVKLADAAAATAPNPAVLIKLRRVGMAGELYFEDSAFSNRHSAFGPRNSFVLFQPASFPARLQKARKPEVTSQKETKTADFPGYGLFQTSGPFDTRNSQKRFLLTFSAFSPGNSLVLFQPASFPARLQKARKLEVRRSAPITG